MTHKQLLLKVYAKEPNPLPFKASALPKEFEENIRHHIFSPAISDFPLKEKLTVGIYPELFSNPHELADLLDMEQPSGTDLGLIITPRTQLENISSHIDLAQYLMMEGPVNVAFLNHLKGLKQLCGQYHLNLELFAHIPKADQPLALKYFPLENIYTY